MIFTATQKLEAIRRSLKYRRRVYSRLDRMAPLEAAYQIGVMEAIAEDYEREVSKERLI